MKHKSRRPWGSILIPFAAFLLVCAAKEAYYPLVMSETLVRYAILPAILVFLVSFFGHRKWARPIRRPIAKWTGPLLFSLLNALFVSFAAVMFVNGAFDYSPEVFHSTKIVGWPEKRYKSESSSTLVAFPPQSNRQIYLPLRWADYEKAEVGDTVHLWVKSGYLGDPWLTRYKLR